MINYSGGLSYITQAMYRARRVLIRKKPFPVFFFSFLDFSQRIQPASWPYE